MAERRMFSKAVIDSDNFIDLPPTAQLLYFHLGMHADDDGFIGNAGSVRRSLGLSEDDLRVLIDRGYLIRFDSGVVAIRHWRVHNFVAKDRRKPTVYTNERDMLTLSEHKVYELVNNLLTQDRLGKDRSGQVRSDEDEGACEDAPAPAEPASSPPSSLQEILDFAKEQGLTSVNVYRFYDYYRTSGWKTPTGVLIDWRLKLRNWNERDGKQVQSLPSPRASPDPHTSGSFDTDDFFEAALKRTLDDF